MKRGMVNNASYRNSFSLIFGILCLGVVYLHSNWVGGFNIYTLGLKNYTIEQMISLVLLAIVPSFFIVWGYLSLKYFSSKENSLEFIKRKLVQFYPIYLLSFVINLAYNYNRLMSFPKWKLMLNVLGLYYESGMGGGGNIYIVVLFVILTVSFLKRIRLGIQGIIVIAMLCMILTKIMPHESTLCYIQYFGYYTAFFVGVVLKHFGIYEESIYVNKYKKALLLFISIIGIMTPLLNLMNIRFVEIQYGPNSFEQLMFCCLLIYGMNFMLNISRLHERKWGFVEILHVIGNNAYGHFIIHSYVIIMIMQVNLIVHLNQFILQLIVIGCTSYISVYWILRLYQIVENRIVRMGKLIHSCPK